MYLPSPESIYYYNKGVSRYALYSLILSAIISLSVALLPAFSAIKDFGWFIGAPLGGIIYYLIANNRVVVLPTDEKSAGQSRPAAQPRGRGCCGGDFARACRARRPRRGAVGSGAPRRTSLCRASV